jgi:hypothetical protein
VKAFTVTRFTHPGAPEFYGGQHATVECAKCHRKTAGRATPFKATPTTCVTCHADPHLGQVSTTCESCHTVAAVKFSADRFAHDKSRFTLAGKHAKVECVKCHKSETAAFPSGRGTATRLTGIETTCKSCHADVHLGQVSLTCETCHSSDGFKVAKYEHSRSLSGFFVGRHKQPKCETCHKTVTGKFPAGRGTAVQFKVGTRCVSCHKDVHNGTLGDDCGACHKPEPLPSAHLADARPRLARSGVGL